MGGGGGGGHNNFLGERFKKKVEKVTNDFPHHGGRYPKRGKRLASTTVNHELGVVQPLRAKGKSQQRTSGVLKVELSKKKHGAQERFPVSSKKERRDSNNTRRKKEKEDRRDRGNRNPLTW